jgi:hypothetical protein
MLSEHCHGLDQIFVTTHRWRCVEFVTTEALGLSLDARSFPMRTINGIKESPEAIISHAYH